jgi:ABC-2 type transport system ATP-binding protein
MGENAVSFHTVTKVYGKQPVVKDVSLAVKAGDIYGLIGKNGAGKTTIMKLITGLAQPSDGHMSILGEDTEKGYQLARQRTGSLIENPYLYPSMDARQNLEYYRRQKGLKDKALVDEALRIVGLYDEKKKFGKFSLGMKQRLGIAQAILGNPELLILDEPINGLDPTGIIEMREMLQKLNREKGTTIVVSSHILNEMSMIANRYAFIHEGKLVEEISRAALEEKCRKHLRLKVNDTEKTAMLLEQHLAIRDYKVLPHHEIEIYDEKRNLNSITKVLIEHDVVILSASEGAQSLEGYFVQLIGGEHHA